MIREPSPTLFDLVMCVSDAADLVSPELVNHHKQVAYIAACIGGELGIGAERCKDLVLAAAVHDIGALSNADRLATMSFETEDSQGHSEVGCSLIKLFEPLRCASAMVRFHHVAWNNGNGAATPDGAPPFESHIIHCADRIAVLIDRSHGILGQADAISKTILAGRNIQFHPQVVDAFLTIAKREYFWLDTVSSTVYRLLRRHMRTRTVTLDLSQLEDFALLLARIIDFRSRFTATHSAGVAVTAERLAELAGFSKRECSYMRIAGFLHDLGKLAVPQEILEKPGALEKWEFDIVRAHTYHTYRILETLDDFDTINTWAAFHHERLKGNGYPFHHTGDDLSLGSRIMAVADVFTAITEDRPYRLGMQMQEAMVTLRTMAASGSLDVGIIHLLEAHLPEIGEVRMRAQAESGKLYRQIIAPKE